MSLGLVTFQNIDEMENRSKRYIPYKINHWIIYFSFRHKYFNSQVKYRYIDEIHFSAKFPMPHAITYYFAFVFCVVYLYTMCRQHSSEIPHFLAPFISELNVSLPVLIYMDHMKIGWSMTMIGVYMREREYCEPFNTLVIALI